MELLLVNPRHVVRKESIASVRFVGNDGEIEILENHAPIFARLAPGLLHIKSASGKVESFFADDGFVLFQDNIAKIAGEKIEAKNEIDLDRVKASHKRAQNRLAGREAGIDISRALIALARAKARQALFSS